jgi:hypothetical protein
MVGLDNDGRCNLRVLATHLGGRLFDLGGNTHIIKVFS